MRNTDWIKKGCHNDYLCCVVDGTLDCATFPNPDNDPEAIKHASSRAQVLRGVGRTCYVARIIQVEEQV